MKEQKKVKLSISIKVIIAVIFAEIFVMLVFSRIEALENLHPAAVAVFDGGFLGVIIIGVITRAFSPLQSMIAAMEQIGKGRLDCRVKIRRHDEMGLIADQINNMARELEESYSKLKESEEFLHVITNGVDYEIMLLDRNYRILWANENILRLSHLDIKAVLGNYCYKVTHGLEFPCREPQDVCPIRKVIKTKKAVSALHTHFHEGGEPLKFEITLYPVMNDKGEIERFIHIGKDVSERIRMVEELEKAKQRLEQYSSSLEDLVQQRTKRLKEANEELQVKEEQLIQSEKMAAIGQLASGVAHEINNPLTVIMNSAQLMQRRLERNRFDVNETRNLMASIVGSVNRVKRVTQALLDFSYVSLAEVKPIDIDVVIDKVLNLVAYEASLENIKIAKRMQQSLPKILGDEQSLQQVFFNLVINAAWAIRQKDSRKGGLITVESRYLIKEGILCVTVSDTGCGIPSVNLNKVFEAFFTTKEVGKGTGLGLSIVYNIIKKHKGDIEVESEINKGTTFRVYLPLPPN